MDLDVGDLDGLSSYSDGYWTRIMGGACCGADTIQYSDVQILPLDPHFPRGKCLRVRPPRAFIQADAGAHTVPPALLSSAESVLHRFDDWGTDADSVCCQMAVGS